ncbi:methyl-accepting chemotaxis protein, partial [Mesorhizobium sp. M00.F.Ca.ET.186.01.1.1]
MFWKKDKGLAEKETAAAAAVTTVTKESAAHQADTWKKELRGLYEQMGAIISQ